MDGRVYAAGELRIACTRGCAAGGSTVGYCITQMQFGLLVSVSMPESMQLSVSRNTRITRTDGDAGSRGDACVSRSVCGCGRKTVKTVTLPRRLRTANNICTYLLPAKIVRVSSP